MKKLFSLSILFILSGMFLVSCGCHPEVITNEVVRIEKVIVHDTVIKTVPDTSSFRAILKVDSLGKVSIDQKTVVSSKGSHLNAPKVSIKDNVISVDCTAKAQELFFQWKEHYLSTQKIQTKRIEVPRELTWWQVTQMWLGRIFIILLIIAGIALFLNWWYKSKRNG